jgi:hypothetical protein
MPPLRFGSDRDTLNKVFKEAIIKANFGCPCRKLNLTSS